MDIETSVVEDRLVVGLNGSLDISGMEKVQSILDRELLYHDGAVDLDFSDVDFIGTTAIAGLLNYFTRFGREGRQLRIINVPDAVARAMKITNLANYL